MKILILSQPKSGSTAMYYKVKAILPEDAAGYFEPTDLGEALEDLHRHQNAVCKYLIQPWKGEPEAGLMELIAAFDKIVVIHRDPRDFMVSCYLYSFYDSLTAHSLPGMAQTLRILERKENHPDSLSFLQLIRLKNALERSDYIKPDLGSISTKHDLFCNRLDLSPHPLLAYNGDVDPEQAALDHDLQMGGFFSYVVRSSQAMIELRKSLGAAQVEVQWMPYADLVAKRFDRVNGYLGAPLMSDGEIDQQYARVVRTKGQGDWKNWVTERDLSWMQEHFEEYLQLFGYDGDWELPDVQHISPSHSSDYVYRLFSERNKHHLAISREALRALGDYLWGPAPGGALRMTGLDSTKSEDFGPPWVRIEDLRFEDDRGEEVNLLVPGRSYHYLYRVSFDQAVTGAAFWMQIGNPTGGGVLNGSSLLGNPNLSDHAPGSSVWVRFPFVCELQNGLYFCNAGVTHREGERLEVLRRRVAAAPIIVFDLPTEQRWVVPKLTVE